MPSHYNKTNQNGALAQMLQSVLQGQQSRLSQVLDFQDQGRGIGVSKADRNPVQGLARWYANNPNATARVPENPFGRGLDLQPQAGGALTPTQAGQSTANFPELQIPNFSEGALPTLNDVPQLTFNNDAQFDAPQVGAQGADQGLLELQSLLGNQPRPQAAPGQAPAPLDPTFTGAVSGVNSFLPDFIQPDSALGSLYQNLSFNNEIPTSLTGAFLNNASIVPRNTASNIGGGANSILNFLFNR